MTCTIEVSMCMSCTHQCIRAWWCEKWARKTMNKAEAKWRQFLKGIDNLCVKFYRFCDEIYRAYKRRRKCCFYRQKTYNHSSKFLHFIIINFCSTTSSLLVKKTNKLHYDSIFYCSSTWNSKMLTKDTKVYLFLGSYHYLHYPGPDCVIAHHWPVLKSLFNHYQ